MRQHNLPWLLTFVLLAATILLVGFNSTGQVGRYQLVTSTIGGRGVTIEVIHRIDTVTGEMDGFSLVPFTKDTEYHSLGGVSPKEQDRVKSKN